MFYTLVEYEHEPALSRAHVCIERKFSNTRPHHAILYACAAIIFYQSDGGRNNVILACINQFSRRPEAGTN